MSKQSKIQVGDLVAVLALTSDKAFFIKEGPRVYGKDVFVLPSTLVRAASDNTLDLIQMILRNQIGATTWSEPTLLVKMFPQPTLSEQRVHVYIVTECVCTGQPKGTQGIPFMHALAIQQGYNPPGDPKYGPFEDCALVAAMLHAIRIVARMDQLRSLAGAVDNAMRNGQTQPTA